MTAELKRGAAWGISLVVLLLAGCQARSTAQHAKLPAPTAAELQAVADKQCAVDPIVTRRSDCDYWVKLQYGIQRNFYNASRFNGRRCALRIRYTDKQRYEVVSTSGDEVLCKKAWGVVSSAENLPPPPKNMPRTFILMFNPGG